jgi:phytoene dehydrogenase-like protein
MSDQTKATCDVIVVGGGLAGLAAATFVARAKGGRNGRVRLFERAEALGGRARTQRARGSEGEYLLNQGAHALYRRGRGIEVLRELDVPVRGGVPGGAKGSAFAWNGGALHPLPAGPVSLLLARWLSWGARVEMASILARLRAEAAASEAMTVSSYLASRVRREEVRRVMAALVRLTTYANDPDYLGAKAALTQVAGALDGNVLYLDGGWQTLVEGLRAAATGAGVELVTGANVEAIEHDGRVRGVRLEGGRVEHASAVIAALGPRVVRGLIGDASPSLRAFDEAARPVFASCLDVALARLPRPDVLFALGLDAPLYFSVHSAAGRLAPAGGAVVHLAKYLAHGERDRDDEGELEAMFDRMQPGWRDVVVERRFLPRMRVAHAAPFARGRGPERPAPRVPEIPGLYVAGDWVGGEGMLVDASLASARDAASLVVEHAQHASVARNETTYEATRTREPVTRSAPSHATLPRDVS